MKKALFVLLLFLPLTVSATDYTGRVLAEQCMAKGDRIISTNGEYEFNFGYGNDYVEVLHNGILVERFQSKGSAWELTHDAALCVGKHSVYLRLNDNANNGFCLPRHNVSGARYFLQMQNDENLVAYIDSYSNPGSKLQVRWALSWGKTQKHMGWWMYDSYSGGTCHPFP